VGFELKMQSAVKPWHLAVAALLVVAIGAALWRSASAPTAPVVTENIPRGANADAALKIKMD
jgi:hypothetical protein